MSSVFAANVKEKLRILYSASFLSLQFCHCAVIFWQLAGEICRKVRLPTVAFNPTYV